MARVVGFDLDRDIGTKAMLYSREALLTVVSIMNDPGIKPAVRLKAAEIIIERAHGRPSQYIRADINKTSSIDLKNISDEELGKLYDILTKHSVVEINPGNGGQGDEVSSST